MGSNALIRGTGLGRSKDSSSIVTEGRQRSVESDHQVHRCGGGVCKCSDGFFVLNGR